VLTRIKAAVRTSASRFAGEDGSGEGYIAIRHAAANMILRGIAQTVSSSTDEIFPAGACARLRGFRFQRHECVWADSK